MIGAALFLRRPERMAFEADDLLVAAQLATHSALGIDKAVLYGREAYIADELQRTMLPETLPRPTGVRLASRYLPAAETARVGGDWYDAIPLPGSRVALVVGDVMGHSMTSAAIMGQLRTTAQTLVGLDLPPQEVLHHLDEQAQRLGTDRMATCLYAVYDPVSHRITIANAGHPPPVLLHLGGRAEVLRVPPGAPIGVGGVDFEAVELDAPAGATLLLYTDGLVESRLRDVWTGIEQLREKLAAVAQLTGPDHPPPLEALCDEVLDMLGPGDRDDDIALLAARFDGIAPSDVAYWFLDPEDSAPARPAAGPARAGPLGHGGHERLGGAAGQRGRDERRAVRLTTGHAPVAADRRAALRGRRRRAPAAAAAPGAGHGRGRTRAVSGQQTGPSVGSHPAEHRKGGLVRTEPELEPVQKLPTFRRRS